MAQPQDNNVGHQNQQANAPKQGATQADPSTRDMSGDKSSKQAPGSDSSTSKPSDVRPEVRKDEQFKNR